jgi:hypothetical protein
MANIHRGSAFLKVVQGVCVPLTAAAVNGVSTDCLGFRRAMVLFGALPTGAGTTSDCKVQESADGSTGWADVAGAAVVQDTTAIGALVQLMDIDLAKRLRYLRLVATGAGGSAAGAAYGAIVLIDPEMAGVTQATAVVSV